MIGTRHNKGKREAAVRLATWRIFVLLLALVATLGVATASTSAAHFHAKPPANGCDICFTAHFASIEAKSLAAVLRAPEAHNCVADCSAFSGYRLYRSSASLTRGPPQSR